MSGQFEPAWSIGLRLKPIRIEISRAVASSYQASQPGHQAESPIEQPPAHADIMAHAYAGLAIGAFSITAHFCSQDNVLGAAVALLIAVYLAARAKIAAS